MKKRHLYIIVSLLLTVGLLSGCSNSDQVSLSEEKVKPVRVQEVSNVNYPLTLEYMGTVDSGTIKKYSFKSAGTVEAIYVEKGELIKKGDKLAQLDTEDLKYAVDAARAQLDTAQAQYNNAINGASSEQIKQAELNVQKATDAYNYAKTSYDDLLELYNDGTVSEQDLEKIELEMNLRKSDLEIAKQIESEAKNGISSEEEKILLAQIEQAKINYDQKKNMLDSATLVSDIDGYVVDILYNEGELVGSGYPVVVVSNNNPVIKVGLTQEDVDKVKIGQKTIVKANGKEVEGSILSIADIPDPQTRTYNIEIGIPDSDYRIGTITDVTIILEEKEGILIPISSILKNGEIYVYVIENNTVVKKEITLGDIKGSNIVVSGLNTGDKLVIEGASKLSVGDKVAIKQ